MDKISEQEYLEMRDQLKKDLEKAKKEVANMDFEEQFDAVEKAKILYSLKVVNEDEDNE